MFSRVAVVSAVLVFMPVYGRAQTPPPSLPDRIDLNTIEVKAAKITETFYTIEGQNCVSRVNSSCGAVGALVGPDGVLLVDGSYAQLNAKIMAAIRQITDAPVRFLVNTHLHGDHTGGNADFAKTGTLIFAREQVRQRMSRPAANGALPLQASLPVVTYDGPVTFNINGEQVELIPIPFAHTDGDTVVRFPIADVLMTGDIYRNLGYPDINIANGGTLDGMLDGLGTIIGLAGPGTRVISGHGAVTDRAGVMRFRDMILVLRDRVSRMIDEGKTVEEVIAARPASDFDASVVFSFPRRAEQFLAQLYSELKRVK